MRKYTHLYFDLDRTLWDFETNISDTLCEMHAFFKIKESVVSKLEWVACYRSINKGLWHDFENKQINKATLRVERFRLLLAHFGLEKDYNAEKLSVFFLENSPFKSTLMPGAQKILDYLAERYVLGIITNGFYDIQKQKLKSGGIEGYFKKVFTSDRYKVAKPKKELFQIALKSLNARKTQSLMIGDSYEKDVLGAKTMGIDQVWYNPEGLIIDGQQATYEINNLLELKNIL